jgi:hypothetical protein
MVRPRRVRPVWLIVGVAAVGLTAGGQSPPPMPLPPSVTKSGPPSSPVSPASGLATQPGQAPIARFQDLKAFPPETVQAVYSVRSGAEWLWRMNQANGRFFPGIDPTLRLPVEGDHDLRQAVAALALAEAARFTGEERYTARAVQAVLALLALTRPDPAQPGQRVPVAPSERCNRVAFAAVTILAIHALPSPEAQQKAEAEALAAFLLTRVRPDGSIQLADSPNEPAARADAGSLQAIPGLALQALVVSYQSKPEETKRATLARIVGHYREVFKAQPHPALAAALIPGLVELALMSGSDATLTTSVYEMADHLCRCQHTRSETRNPMWLGGFRSSPTATDEAPGIGSAECAAAISAAVKLTRRTADTTRFRTYRQAAIDGFAFVRGLQFTDETVDHFDRSFRTRFLVGGAHPSLTVGTVRIDATAALVSSQLRYLQSGAETRPE